MHSRHPFETAVNSVLLLWSLIALCLALAISSGCTSAPKDLEDLIRSELPEPAIRDSESWIPPDVIPFASCRFFETSGPNAQKMAVTVRIVSVTISGGRISWVTEPAILPWKDVNGCNGELWCFIQDASGQWLASPGDNIATGRPWKSAGDFKLYDGTEVLRPPSRTRAGFMLSTRCRHSNYPNGLERSNIVYVDIP